MVPEKQMEAGDQRSNAGQKSRPALERSLNILEAVAVAGAPVALTDLAQKLSLPQATAFRLCEKLENDGYLVREGGSKKYSIGVRLMRLGLDIVRSGGPAHARHAILSELVAQIGETCNLTALSGSEILYLDRVETQWPLRLSLETGSRVPLHCTSSGKLLLAELPPGAQSAIIESLKLPPHTPKTITDRTELKRELKRIARAGFSIDNEEFLTGLICVAVPIRDGRGQTLAAVACHAPVVRVDKKRAVELVPLLQAAAAELAKSFEG